jgi:UDP-N-acetylmuramoylalanine--D-glutamate ligase
MNVLVLGGAVSGRAAALLARRLGHSVMVYDQHPEVLAAIREERLPVTTGAWAPSLLSDVDLVVASPGFGEFSEPIRDASAAGITLWSELEFAWRHLEVPVVAVTGTNGKTTVTALIADMLARSGRTTRSCGNIGTPLSDVVDQSLDVAVVETSSFQLRFTDQFRPDTAVVLNVAPDHLDWHRSFEAYLAAKASIHRNQTNRDLLIYDVDDGGAVRAISGAVARLLPVSGKRRPDGGMGVNLDKLDLGDLAIPLTDIPVSDPAFLLDLVAAAAAALAHGAHAGAVEEAIVTFRPEAHRRTLVGSWAGVRWIDDSKATNPHAAIASAEAYESVVLIAGGRNKGLDLSGLPAVSSIRHVIAIGEAGPEIAEASGALPVDRASTMEEAVALADAAALPGDTVLLAPGCASFDMYTSYAERGDVFADAVVRRKGDT